MLSDSSEAAGYERLGDSIRAAYNREFFDPQSGAYASGSQTSQLVSLLFGMVPSDKQELARQKLVERIALDSNNLSTGFVGTPLLLPGLVELGMPDLAWTIATQPDYPGFIDAVLNRGNSVMKEDWKGGLVQMPSLQGPIGAWFYHSLAGIRASSDGPGFKKITIRPETAGTLSWVRAWHESPYGRIESSWKRGNGRFRLSLKIPGNTTATVYLPAKAAPGVKEGGKRLENVTGVVLLRMEGDRAVIGVGAGSYEFESDF
jgi:alpha-L-rhamnosidase